MDKPETESKLTVKRDGILYKLNSREPYSGIVFQNFANGNLEFRASYVNGRLEGVKDTYNSNGELASTTTYLNGEKNGAYKKFDMEGKIVEKSNYRNGLLDGLKEVSDDIWDIGLVKQKLFFNDGVLGTIETTFPDSNQIWWKSTLAVSATSNFNQNENEEVPPDRDTVHFTKSGAIDYVEHLRDGITLDENYKKKKKMNIFDEYKKKYGKKNNKQVIKKKISNEQIIISTFLFFVIAYSIFRFIRAFEERGIIF